MKKNKQFELKPINGKKISIIGLGKSGLATAEVLGEMGADIFLSDAANGKDLIKRIDALSMPYEIGGHTLKAVNHADIAVVSPGVPSSACILAEFDKRGIPVLSEIEVAYQLYLKGPIIAITGSNGKSTVTSLIGEILEHQGLPVKVAGNIGYPFIKVVKNVKPETWMIIEVSSFQLERIINFRPKISILLNITPDHLDRHRTMAVYKNLKARIFFNQCDEDHAIVNLDDPVSIDVVEKAILKNKMKNIHVVFYSTKTEIEKNGLWVKDGMGYHNLSGISKDFFEICKLKLPGEHNLSNCLAATAASLIAGATENVIQEVLYSFSGLEHRLEKVAEFKGIKFYNDSKATNVDSMLCAIKSFKAPINLIAGGRDKSGDFSTVVSEIKKRVKSIVLIGEAAEKLEIVFKDLSKPIVKVANMRIAVETASSFARAGEVVLLAPGCTSFDMFKNFEERGYSFKKAVDEWGRKKE